MVVQVECRDATTARTAPAFTPAVGRRHFVATYHYVRERNSDGVTGVTPAEFAAQIRALRNQYPMVTAEEFVAAHAETDGLALVTFDDALRDQVRAAEILDRLGAPGVFYAPLRPYADETERWCPQHLLHALAERLGWAELERRVAPHVADVPIDAAEVDRLYHYEVPHKRRLKYALAFALPAARAAAVLHETNRDVGLAAEDWYLTRRQLAALQDAGHALGGHGFDHVPYSTLPVKAQAADMHRAVRTMNALFGALPRTIAFPFGRASPATEALARGCGYTLGFTTANRIDARDVPAELARRADGD